MNKNYPNGYFDCPGCGATKQSTNELCDSCKGLNNDELVAVGHTDPNVDEKLKSMTFN